MEQQNAQFKQQMAAQNLQQEMQNKAMIAKLDEAIQTHSTNMKTAQDQLALNQTLMQNHMSHQQQVVHKQVDHQQKVHQTEQMGHIQRQQAAKQKPPSKGK